MPSPGSGEDTAGDRPDVRDRPEARAGADARARIARIEAQLQQRAARVQSGTVGSVQRRMQDLQISRHALVFAALAMVLFVPALISLSALLPIGREHGLADRWAQHLALSAEARSPIRHLFTTDRTVRNATSVIGAVVTVLAAYAWPAELQRVYEAVWGLPSRGWRALWRPLVWLASTIAVLVVVAAVGSLAAGVAGAALTAVLCSPLVFGWSWWMQRFLLAGRAPWSALLPGALVTSVGLAGFSVVTSIYLSRAIVYNAERYGPIGVVFVLMSWLTWFSLVLLGGAVVGHAVHQRRCARPGGSEGLPPRSPPPARPSPTVGLTGSGTTTSDRRPLR